jgi:hypothetical protein
MRIQSNACLVMGCLALATILSATSLNAQGVMSLPNSVTIALKSGESVEVYNLYWVVACRSLLKSPPEVEIIDGPSQVTASVKETMIVPRWQNCSKPVSGGTLVLTAKEIEDPSFSRLTLRVTYKTRDGDRKHGEVLNLQLIP